MTYFNSIDLSGPSAFAGCDPALDHLNWGTAGPAPGVGIDFSARWSTTRSFAGGSATFTTRSDDGIRVIVDGRTILSRWTNHSARNDRATVSLTAGVHSVVVEFFDSGDAAVARLVIT